MNRSKTAMLRAILGMIVGILSSTSLMSQEPDKSVKIIEPQSTIVKADTAELSSGRFELGLYTGMLSVEDFNSNTLLGLSATYHINDQFSLALQLGQSDVDRATFEDFADGDFLAEDDRTFEYTQLVGGYRLFHGRSYSSESSKFNSNIYLLLGVGNIDFAGSSETGLILGSSYKTVLKDWLTWELTIKDHLVDRSFLDNSKKTHNVELSIGLNLLF